MCLTHLYALLCAEFFSGLKGGLRLHTQNECRMHDAGRTPLTAMIWFDLQGDVTMTYLKGTKITKEMFF